MKIVKTLVLALTGVAALGLGGEEPPKVPFALGPGHFKEGDQIVIKEVLCTSTNFTLGDKVVVRGQYGLKSQEGATLCLFVGIFGEFSCWDGSRKGKAFRMKTVGAS